MSHPDLDALSREVLHAYQTMENLGVANCCGLDSADEARLRLQYRKAQRSWHEARGRLDAAIERESARKRLIDEALRE